METSQDDMKLLFGAFDESIRRIEEELSVDITDRDGKLNIYGTEKNVKRATRLILDLIESSKAEKKLDRQKLDYGLSLAKNDRADVLVELDKDIICRTVQGKPVKPKTEGQKKYVDFIRDKMITFGSGPAGTGKTYLAIAMAVTAFKSEEVGRIILTRPAIEAGEKLGFLPGDLQSKVDPYLRPLYDALYQIMGADSFQKNVEKGLIEVAPLAYMRGRTLDNSFIILDEAQNTTPGQMKMFLTRIGFGSKAVITGDLTQKDLAVSSASGLEEALKVLGGIDDIGFATLTSRDVVRHPLVMKIVQAYEKYEKNSLSGRGRKHGRRS
ncbi:MAG: PhoH family protein [Lachnospiraceae bacterium]|nr:PhoH family protein [Lachnospiraceae bacterium]